MSREAELYKDKIEVSLDGRQIFYLFFGGAVIVGLVFVLGVMVGRRVEARGHTDRARVAATVDPLAALDRLEGGGGLSFQGALRGAEGPVSDVEKQIAALPKRKPVEPPKAEKVEKKAVEPVAAEKKAAEPKPEDAKKAAEPKPEEPKKADKPAEPAKATDKPVTDPKEVDAPKAEDKAADKAESAKPDKKTKYTLQLSSFQEKSEAQAYFDEMKAAGYPVYMTQGSVDGKQYFRVRVGSYSTLEAANQARAELDKSLRKNAIVIKL